MKDSYERGWDERTVTVNREKLLQTLKENREKHAAEYQQALLDYQQLATDRLQKLYTKSQKLLEENFASIQAKIDVFDPDEPVASRVTILEAMSFSLKVPEDHTKAYDVAIQMAEWEVAEVIELTQSQFQCFVLDDWDWKEEFSKMSKTYSLENRRLFNER